MSCKTWLQVLAVAGIFVVTAAAQVVAPPTPRNFKTRGVGGSDVDVNVATPQQPNSTALIQTLRIRVDGLIRQRRYDDAETAALDLLQRSPNDEHAIMCLRMIQAARGAAEAPLQKMIVPKVEFREANLTDVLKFLQEISGGLTADKRPLSFVLQLPPGTTVPAVTLSLQNVPMLDVIRYVTNTAGLSFKVEPHAVVIYKQQAAPLAPVAPPTTP